MKIKDILGEDDGSNKVTAANSDGSVEITSNTGVKTILPKDQATALAPDPTNPNKLNLNKDAVAPTDGKPTGPQVGSDVDMTTKEEMDTEEEVVERINGEDDPDLIGYEKKHHKKNRSVGGDATDDFINDIRDKDFEKHALPTGGRESSKFKEELESWKRIAGL